MPMTSMGAVFFLGRLSTIAVSMVLMCPLMVAVTEPYGIWGGMSESERELLLERDIRRAS